MTNIAYGCMIIIICMIMVNSDRTIDFYYLVILCDSYRKGFWERWE